MGEKKKKTPRGQSPLAIPPNTGEKNPGFENYQQGPGTTASEGFLAYDDSISGKRPGVLVVHQCSAWTDLRKHRAEQLASLGYVAFCRIIYGKGRPSKNCRRGYSHFHEIQKRPRTFCAKTRDAGLTN